MKKRLLPLLLMLALFLCLAPAAAAEEDDGWNTDVSAIPFVGNQGANYVITAQLSTPSRSFLFANDAGGVTLVECGLKPDFSNAEEALLVAEFDGELEPLRWRLLGLPNAQRWCGFLNGTDYYYVIYSTGGSGLSVDQYNKDWTLKQRSTRSVANTSSFPHNDFDVCQAGDRIVIATNHTMSNGHEANLRLELDAETLALKVAQKGVADYQGYASHAYLPEAVYNDGFIYTIDHATGIPKEGVVLSTYEGSLGTCRKLLYGPLTAFNNWQDWGSLGNAVPAGGGILLAYDEGPYSNSDPDGPARCNVYLYYGNARTKTQKDLQISFNGKAATPFVTAIDENHGYVLWNQEVRSDRDASELDYIPWTITEGELSVGEIRTATDRLLSDCEPIPWKGGLLWFTVNGYGDLKLHTLGADGSLGLKDFHRIHRWETLSTTEPTCVEDGCTEQRCLVCGVEETEVIPALGHYLMEFRKGSAPTCLGTGTLDYYYCWRCHKDFADEAGTEELEELTIPALGHDWQEELLQEADCVTQTDGSRRRTCARCGKIETETLYYRLAHQLEHIEAKEPGCTEAGWYEHYRCSVCKRMYADEGANREYYYVGKLALGHACAWVERQEPTETVAGHIGHYLCSRCGKTFSDEYGNYELTAEEVLLPASHPLPGDIDQDGRVDRADAARLFRLVSAGDRPATGELTGDGRVNSRDALLLFWRVA